MASFDVAAVPQYKNAINSLMEQIDAIKVQFVQITNQMREKKGQGIRLPVSDYSEFLVQANSALLPQSKKTKDNKTLSLSGSLSLVKSTHISERLKNNNNNNSSLRELNLH